MAINREAARRASLNRSRGSVQSAGNVRARIDASRYSANSSSWRSTSLRTMAIVASRLSLRLRRLRVRNGKKELALSRIAVRAYKFVIFRRISSRSSRSSSLFDKITLIQWLGLTDPTRRVCWRASSARWSSGRGDVRCRDRSAAPSLRGLSLMSPSRVNCGTSAALGGRMPGRSVVPQRFCEADRRLSASHA
jgi:hypothetical protein